MSGGLTFSTASFFSVTSCSVRWKAPSMSRRTSPSMSCAVDSLYGFSDRIADGSPRSKDSWPTASFIPNWTTLKTQHSQADFTQFSKRSTGDLIELIFFLPVRKQTAWLSWGRPAPPWWPAGRKPARPLDPQASRTSCQAAALGWRGTVPLVDTVHNPNHSLWGQWTPWREHSDGCH